MKRQPEEQFVVEVTPSDEIVCRQRRAAEQRVPVADVGAIYFESSDDLLGFDWWLLMDKAGEVAVAFPLGATGQETVLERLRLLPGFEIGGMNSTGHARFLCWKAPTGTA